MERGDDINRDACPATHGTRTGKRYTMLLSTLKKAYSTLVMHIYSVFKVAENEEHIKNQPSSSCVTGGFIVLAGIWSFTSEAIGCPTPLEGTMVAAQRSVG